MPKVDALSQVFYGFLPNTYSKKTTSRNDEGGKARSNKTLIGARKLFALPLRRERREAKETQREKAIWAMY